MPSFMGKRHGAPWATIARAFTPGECARLTALCAREQGHEGGLVAGREEASVRRSTLVWVPEDEEFAWAHTRMARLAADANREHFRFALDGFEEQLQIAAYGPGHFYDWHIDRGQGHVAGRRKLTLSVQLADPADYEGGALELNPDGHVVEGPREQGAATVFPANMLHRVAPVTAGLRHSLVAWIHGPDFV